MSSVNCTGWLEPICGNPKDRKTFIIWYNTRLFSPPSWDTLSKMARTHQNFIKSFTVNVIKKDSVHWMRVKENLCYSSSLSKQCNVSKVGVKTMMWLTSCCKVWLSRYFPSNSRPTSGPGLCPVLSRGPGRASDPDPHAAPASGHLLGDDDLVVLAGVDLAGLVPGPGPGQSVAPGEGGERVLSGDDPVTLSQSDQSYLSLVAVSLCSPVPGLSSHNTWSDTSERTDNTNNDSFCWRHSDIRHGVGGRETRAGDHQVLQQLEN